MQLGFGTGILTATALQNAAGVAVANATPVQFGTMQEVTGDLSFEEKLLYGAQQFPIAVGRGKGKLSFKAKTADIKGLILSDLFFGLPSTAGSRQAVNDFRAIVPEDSPYTIEINPPNSGTYMSDLGVRDGETGLELKKTSGTPAAGEYSVDEEDGIYLFHASAAEAPMLISYEYSAAGGKTIALTNQLMGQAPVFKAHLNTSYLGKHLTLNLTNCVSNKFSLPFKSDDFMIPDFEFSAFADGAGNIGYISLAE